MNHNLGNVSGGIILMVMTWLNVNFGDVNFLTEEDWDKEVGNGIVVVEFWAGWNSINEVKELDKLKDAEIFKVNIDTEINLMLKHKVSSIPTVIIYNNGKEEERWEADITFKASCDRKDIQEKIDELYSSKF